MTEASIRALDGLRDWSHLQWNIIPLLAIVMYIYAREVRRARKSGDWNAILAGLTVFGMDFFNETWNGWVLHFSDRSAFWTAPGPTSLRVMVGWNIEILFMFLLAGLVFYNTLTEQKDKKILGLNEMWFWGIAFSVFCVLVECLLNIGGHLVWEYAFWNRSFGGVWLIFLFGYFEFFVAAIFVITRKTTKAKLMTIGIIYAVPVIMNTIAGLAGWVY
ncbi:MAG: hypothetical protein JW874_00040 [Spirochaetales bacterium]|nr:hypothetical protein [Spirochaetales bacterium]